VLAEGVSEGSQLVALAARRLDHQHLALSLTAFSQLVDQISHEFAVLLVLHFAAGEAQSFLGFLPDHFKDVLNIDVLSGGIEGAGEVALDMGLRKELVIFVLVEGFDFVGLCLEEVGFCLQAGDGLRAEAGFGVERADFEDDAQHV
jgi:hypothetical protein